MMLIGYISIKVLAFRLNSSKQEGSVVAKYTMQK